MIMPLWDNKHMSENNSSEKIQPQSSLWASLITGVVFYTIIGLGAGILYSYASTTVTAGLLTVIGLTSFLALWWAYVLVVLAPIVLLVLVYRATDPALQDAIKNQR